MNRGVTIAALSACGAAGAIVAVLLTAAPGAGADGGTTTAPTTTEPTTTAPTTTEPTTTVPTTTVPTVTTPTTPTTTTPAPPQPKLIVAGVTIGGTLVGGLTAAEARELVKARFSRPLTLVGGQSRFVVTPKELGATSRLEKAVKLAARVKRAGYVVPLEVDVSRPKVERLIASLGKRFDRDPVDATLRLRNLTPFATKDVAGRRLKEVIAARAVVLALKTQKRDPLQLPFEQIDAAVKSNSLGRAIVIRRGSNQLLLYRVASKPKLIRQFQVATGRSQYPTPLGKFEIVNKQYNPWWYPPAGSEWAQGAEPIPPGPGNPLGTRWMGLSAPYVGIHGTPDAASIGYSASHGCVRMLIPQVEWLFTQVQIGTPVFVVAA